MVCSVPSFPKGLRVKMRQWGPRPHPKKEHVRGFWKDVSFFDPRSRAPRPQALRQGPGERVVQEAGGSAFVSCSRSDGRGPSSDGEMAMLIRHREVSPRRSREAAWRGVREG